MKRLLAGFFVLLLAAVVLVACSPKPEQEPNITFAASVLEVSENGVLVETADDVGFDKAYVSYEAGYLPEFTPEPGQRVQIEILPAIRESYPVQVTAVAMTLAETM